MKRLCRQILLLLGVAAGMAPAWAARDFTPQAGTWVIDAELDGKPGRGLAIDVQGNTVVLQVYGYEANGAASLVRRPPQTSPCSCWRAGIHLHPLRPEPQWPVGEHDRWEPPRR